MPGFFSDLLGVMLVLSIGIRVLSGIFDNMAWVTTNKHCVFWALSINPFRFKYLLAIFRDSSALRIMALMPWAFPEWIKGVSSA